MRQQLLNLVERLFQGSNLTAEQLLWLVFLGGMVLATIQIFTMLITHWGDRGVTTKSFIFSVLVHLCCTLGLVAVNPSSASVPAREIEEDNVPIQLTELFTETEDKAEQTTPSENAAPVWEKPPEPAETQLSRLDRLPVEELPTETPERRQETNSKSEIPVPEVASLPEELVVTPQPKAQDQSAPRAEADKTVTPDENTTEARAEVNPATGAAERNAGRNEQIDTTVKRPQQARPSEQIRISPRETREVAKLETSANPDRFLKRDYDTETANDREDSSPASTPNVQEGPEAAANGTADDGNASPETGEPTRRSRPTSAQQGEPGAGEAPLVRRSRPSTEAGTDTRMAARVNVPVEVARGGPVPNADRGQPGTAHIAGRATAPTTYQLRNLGRRTENARKFGGTERSEQAVELSLKWLAVVQTNDGFWDGDAFGAGNVVADADGRDERGVFIKDGVPGRHADTGLTGLATLAFLGAGYTHEEGPYTKHVERALRWLIKQQQEDGYLGGDAAYYERMYCHAMATYALAEAYGMQSDPTVDTAGLRAPLIRAVGYILDNQNPDGGWRYRKGQKSDMSMFGWQLMALKSADIAGIPIPKETRERMLSFLRESSLGERKGLATYRQAEPAMPHTPAMTAEALFCKQMLGIERAHPASAEAAEFLMQNLPRRSETNFYYWYYGTLAMYQYGGKSWQDWNEQLRDQLIDAQRTSGDLAGSWDPRGPWGSYGGRIFSTALATLSLEVYYRFLPLYQMGGKYTEN